MSLASARAEQSTYTYYVITIEPPYASAAPLSTCAKLTPVIGGLHAIITRSEAKRCNELTTTPTLVRPRELILSHFLRLWAAPPVLAGSTIKHGHDRPHQKC